jgi:antibiotic biosynthesis monooxygenase (ABM) superfamily enzyme
MASPVDSPVVSASLMDAPSAGNSPVTIVTQTRVEPEKTAEFGRWQHHVNSVVSDRPGFIDQTVMPPAPPVQVDWVILQRFANSAAAIAWLRSDERQRLVAEVQPILIGPDDVHLVADSGSGAMPAPASAVISTRIKAGQTEAYRAWERKIAAAQAQSPGFQGFRFEPPMPGVQDDWLTILRFDSEANLQRWLDSPERLKLLEEAAVFTDEYRTRIVRTGFDQWFQVADPATPPPAGWQQNMIVLMMLYPLVFLITAWFEHPLLVGRWQMPHWSALFLDNAVGVLLLSFIAPLVSKHLGWWLYSPGHNRKRELAGVALILGFYALSLLITWQYEVHIWRPW